jgi:hypothetical protein
MQLSRDAKFAGCYWNNQFASSLRAANVRHTPFPGCTACIAASCSCATCRSKGSMVTISTRGSRRPRDEDDRRNPMVSRKGQTLDKLFVGHHPIAGRRQQPIHALQTEGSMERDGLAGRPYRHRRTSFKLEEWTQCPTARLSAAARAHPRCVPHVP